MEWELTIRLIFFFGVFAIMAYWETRAPKRKLSQPKTTRWFNNLSLVALNTIVLRLIFPIAAVGMALLAQEQGWGILNNVEIEAHWAILISVIALDLIIYFQHVMFHAVPLLWRLHRVHHADMDYDVTTGLRFHPIEIVLSMLIKFAAIMVLGPPAIAVVIFEILLNGCAMFNHGNIALPKQIDRVIRWLFVTPDMHRVHHSTIKQETNSNYGFSLSCWDRIFGTYRNQPQLGHQGMTIGLNQFRDPKHQFLNWLLLIPFIGPASEYPINEEQSSSSDEKKTKYPD